MYRPIEMDSLKFFLFSSACDIYWWGIVLKRRIFPGMSGMIRVNLLKPVSSYFSCHFPTVMLLPKWSLFILLASLFLLFVRQSGLFTSAVKCFVKDRSGDSREKFATSTRMSARIYPESKLQVSLYFPDGKSKFARFLANSWGVPGEMC